MSEILSNEEIESLMEMVNSPDAEFHDPMNAFGPIATDESAATVGPLDLLKPSRLSTEALQELERIFAGSAQALGSAISDQMRYTLHCDCVGVEEMSFSDWGSLVAGTSATYVLNAEPLRVPLLFSVSRGLLYGFVDRVLGGHGHATEIPKEFSAAEFAIADDVLSPLFGQFARSLSDFLDLSIQIEDRSTDPSRARILPSQDVVLAVHFQVGSDQLLGDLRIAIAHSELESFLGGLTKRARHFGRVAGAQRAEIADRLQPVDVELGVHLGSTRMTLREILELRVGQIVVLDQRVGDPVVMPVAGVEKFQAKLGTVGSRLGCRIESVVE